MATSSAAFKSFRKAGVVVFANSKTDSGLLPAGVREVRSKGGNTIPMVFVTNSDGSKGLDAVPYTKLKSDMRASVRDLRKSLETLDVVAGTETPSKENAEPVVEDWVNSEGKTISAAAKEVSGDSIIFVMANGKEVTYPMAKLSTESREKAEALRE